MIYLKIDVKMNLRIKTKNHAADPEKGSLTKSISKPYGCATAMPPAWELITLTIFFGSGHITPSER